MKFLKNSKVKLDKEIGNTMTEDQQKIDELKNSIFILQRKSNNLDQNFSECMEKFFDYKKRVDTWIQDQHDKNIFNKEDLENFAKIMNYKITNKYKVSILMEQDVFIDAENDEDLQKIVTKDLKIDLLLDNDKIKGVIPKITIKNFKIE